MLQSIRDFDVGIDIADVFLVEQFPSMNNAQTTACQEEKRIMPL
jgi:hypothetical protein